MWFLQLVTLFALLGFVAGLFEAFVEGMKSPPHWLVPIMSDPTSHYLLVWLLAFDCRDFGIVPCGQEQGEGL